MNYRTSLLAAGAAIAFAGLANAQGYGLNWAAANDTANLAYLTGPTLFQFAGPAINYPGPGDSIRKCYGIDQTQGGSNQDGTSELNLFRVIQGWDPNANPGVDVGLVSAHSASINSLSGDACFSPIFAQAGLNNTLGFAGVIGVINGTQGTPAPGFWNVVFSFAAPVAMDNVLGTDSNGFPLLANVIYEVQGPLNNSAASNQYYIASTAEVTGLLPAATGGVTNGNSQLASALFGLTADQSNAVSHTRLTAEQGGTVQGTTMPFGAPGQLEMSTDLGFATPQVWASNNGNAGVGGPDWSVSGPVSNINLRYLDVLGGAQTTPGTTVFNPCILFNSVFFLWSATPAAAMLQKPMSWDSSLVPFLPPQPGSIALGTVATARQGAQTVPINFDSLTLAFLGSSALSLGGSITPASSQFAGDPQPLAGDTLFQGGFDPIANGVTGLGTGGGPIVAVPNPALSGLQLGIAGVGLQFDACVSAVVFTEFGSSLHVSLQ